MICHVLLGSLIKLLVHAGNFPSSVSYKSILYTATKPFCSFDVRLGLIKPWGVLRSGDMI